jgi:hypothetical protein
MTIGPGAEDEDAVEVVAPRHAQRASEELVEEVQRVVGTGPASGWYWIVPAARRAA